MRYTRIVTLGIALLACTPVLGTQVVASQLRYASWLGSPVLRLRRRGLYMPYQYAVWYWHYAWYYPAPFDWGLAVMAGWLIAGAVLIAVLLSRAGWHRHRATDPAEGATARELGRANLFVRRSK